MELDLEHDDAGCGMEAPRGEPCYARPMSARYHFWRRWLLVASVLFGLQAVGWAVLGRFDPLGVYDGYAARSLFGSEALPPDAERFQSFILGPFGATTAGYFILVFYMAKIPLARREAWALWAVTAAVLFWFALDTALSAFQGAWFNVVIVNLPCLAVLGPALWGLHAARGESAESAAGSSS